MLTNVNILFLYPNRARTTAGAAAWAPGQLLVIGGAPSMCSAEAVWMMGPDRP